MIATDAPDARHRVPGAGAGPHDRRQEVSGASGRAPSNCAVRLAAAVWLTLTAPAGLADSPLPECGPSARCVVFTPASDGVPQAGEVLDPAVLQKTRWLNFRVPFAASGGNVPSTWWGNLRRFFGASGGHILSTPVGNAAGNDVSDYPAFHFVVGRGCTGTAIGERVLLTSAHCVRDDAHRTRFFVTSNGKPHEMYCDAHPDYQPAANSGLCGVSTPECTADVAACWIADPSLKLRHAKVAVAADAAVRPAGPLWGPTPRSPDSCDSGVDASRLDVVSIAGTSPPTGTRRWPTTFQGRNLEYYLCPGDSGSAFYTATFAVAGILSEVPNDTLMTFQVAVTADKVRTFLKAFEGEQQKQPTRPAKPRTPIEWER